MRACLHAREHACLLVFVRVCVGALSSQPNLPAGLMAPHWLQPLPSTGDCTASTLPGGEASSNGFHPDFRSGCSGVAGCWVWAAGARSAKRSSRSMLDVAARVDWSSCPVTPKRSSSASPSAAIFCRGPGCEKNKNAGRQRKARTGQNGKSNGDDHLQAAADDAGDTGGAPRRRAYQICNRSNCAWPGMNSSWTRLRADDIFDSSCAHCLPSRACASLCTGSRN